MTSTSYGTSDFIAAMKGNAISAHPPSQRPGGFALTVNSNEQYQQPAAFAASHEACATESVS